jgi:hypothetical protein
MSMHYTFASTSAEANVDEAYEKQESERRGRFGVSLSSLMEVGGLQDQDDNMAMLEKATEFMLEYDASRLRFEILVKKAVYTEKQLDEAFGTTSSLHDDVYSRLMPRDEDVLRVQHRVDALISQCMTRTTGEPQTSTPEAIGIVEAPSANTEMKYDPDHTHQSITRSGAAAEQSLARGRGERAVSTHRSASLEHASATKRSTSVSSSHGGTLRQTPMYASSVPASGKLFDTVLRRVVPHEAAVEDIDSHDRQVNILKLALSSFAVSHGTEELEKSIGSADVSPIRPVSAKKVLQPLQVPQRVPGEAPHRSPTGLDLSSIRSGSTTSPRAMWFREEQHARNG